MYQSARRNDKVLPLTLGIDEGLGIGSLRSVAASTSIRGRGHLCFIDMASRSALKETLSLIGSYSDVLDMVIENRELSLDMGETNSKASKPFGSICQSTNWGLWLRSKLNTVKWRATSPIN